MIKSLEVLRKKAEYAGRVLAVGVILPFATPTPIELTINAQIECPTVSGEPIGININFLNSNGARGMAVGIRNVTADNKAIIEAKNANPDYATQLSSLSKRVKSPISGDPENITLSQRDSLIIRGYEIGPDQIPNQVAETKIEVNCP